MIWHEKVDTTLDYAHHYDGTVAADYYHAMGQIERFFDLAESQQAPVSTPAELVALVMR